jgi:hypothetical protein
MKQILTELLAKYNHILYKPDGIKDYWQTPAETRRLGTGDCDDFCLLFYFELKAMGYNPFIMYGRIAGKAHMACICGRWVIDTVVSDWYDYREHFGLIYRMDETQLITVRNGNFHIQKANINKKWVDVLDRIEKGE